MPATREKLEDLKKNVHAQEERLGEAMKIFDQLSQTLSTESELKEGNDHVVLYETLNTAVTILGDLVASYRKYTEELEKAVQKSTRRRDAKSPETKKEKETSTA